MRSNVSRCEQRARNDRAQPHGPRLRRQGGLETRPYVILNPCWMEGYWADAFAARSIKRATSSGLER